MSPREKVLFMKPVLVPLLPASCAGRVHSIPILFAVSVLILVWIGGFVKEVVFDWGLSGNSLFSGIMEGLPVMLLGWCAGKDTTGEATLCFSVCKK